MSGARTTAALFLALGLTLGLAPSASAERPPRWAPEVATVCVESHVPAKWGLARALARWNAARPSGAPVLQRAATCPEFGSVVVSINARPGRYTGWTNWWSLDGYMHHVAVTLNPRAIRRYERKWRGCERRHATGHEIGHALGLDHYPHSNAGSVMSYEGWKGMCGALSARDRADLSARYAGGAS